MKYDIILIDAPWKYKSRANHKTKFRGGIHGHYKGMIMQQIKQLPIPDLAADNCLLFLWCTFPYHIDQLELYKHWGFKYKTIGFIWIKQNLNVDKQLKEYMDSFNAPRKVINPQEIIKKVLNMQKPFFGTGHYAAANAEPCYLGTKGSKFAKVWAGKQSSVVIYPRSKHSSKPEEIQDKIEIMWPRLTNRLELFARRERPGWTCLGDEISGNDIFEDLKNIL